MRWRLRYLMFAVSAAMLLIGWTISQRVTPAQGETVTALPADADEVYVPAGQFAMGCSNDLSSVKCDNDAKPIHLVYLDDFFIDRTEVSNADYAACVDAGKCRPPLDDESVTRDPYYGNPAYDDYPVIHVDWWQASGYCAWRGKRLPTEAEWEKAARGTDMRLFPWGNREPDCEQANIALLSGHRCVGDTTPVESYPDGASPYGAINMVGNVREWVNDLYKQYYYSTSPYYNPQGPDYTDKNEHLVRGGSWDDHTDVGSNVWVRIDEANIYYTEAIGFRCARDVVVRPTPTPSPTLTPTPVPSDAGSIGPKGGSLWISYPDHLTVLHVPSDTLTAELDLTVTYTKTRPGGQLHGMDHFFVVSGETFTEPVTLLLGFKNAGGIIAGTADLYRLEAGSWVTNGITLREQSSGHVLAQIEQPGLFGILGQTNRTYLPITIRQ
ncbi:MAG: formylglycine-generating enzyme family protein [Anaerolineae bacterium]